MLLGGRREAEQEENRDEEKRDEKLQKKEAGWQKQKQWLCVG